MHTYHQVIDANINRVSEGLRVIEDYVRFISQNKQLTKELSLLRKELNFIEKDKKEHLLIRDTTKDMRAKEVPAVRKNIHELLKANFKRVEEGLRVLEEYTGNATYNKARYIAYELEKEVLLSAMRKPITSGVYLISDNIDILEKGLTWKVSCIQLRDKTSNKKIVLEKAKKIQKKAKKAGIPFIINDYIDVAMLSDADGLHTGQDDLDIPSIRKLLGPHKIIGRSTHSLEEGLEAQNNGADYVGIGPIFETPTKDEKAIGTSYLKKAKQELHIPYVAIGGINGETMKDIAPLRPPLVAVVRAWKEIPKIQKEYKKLFASHS